MSSVNTIQNKQFIRILFLFFLTLRKILKKKKVISFSEGRDGVPEGRLLLKERRLQGEYLCSNTPPPPTKGR